ncbi:hypothetical protein KC368_g37 [Hortaea werneckii]|nr:hypothetical protein KC368_g37 [Hortaea werneckii]
MSIPLTAYCFLYSSTVCSVIGLEMAMPAFATKTFGQMVSSRLDNMHLRFSSDAMLLRKSVTFSDSCIIAPVPEGQIASSFGDGFGCSETNAIRGSRDGNHLALHTQLLKHIVWSVWGWLRIPGDRRFVKGHRHDEWMMRIDLLIQDVIVLMCSGSSERSRPTPRSTFLTRPTYN